MMEEKKVKGVPVQTGDAHHLISSSQQHVLQRGRRHSESR